MTFQEFIVWSDDISRTAPDVIRICETRISRAFRSILPTGADAESDANVHRCDLARDWCEVRNLPSGAAERTLLCEGVRHALALIFTELVSAGRRVALPSDVYPVYWRIASEAGLDAVVFDTFPDFDLPTLLRTAESSGADVVLLPVPLKLQGREWTEDEAVRAVAWLGRDRRRRLILDGVYSFGLPITPLVANLLKTEQVIYLDSLSKGWLHEKTLGAAMFPASDLALYSSRFRTLSPAQAKLRLARDLLLRFPQFPVRLTEEVDRRREALMVLLENAGVSARPAHRGYLVVLEGAASALLQDHRLLALPATAFGSSLDDWSIASALPSLQ